MLAPPPHPRLLEQPWVLQVALVVGGALLAGWLAHRLLRRAEELARRTANSWDDALFRAAGRPLRWLIAVVSLGLVVDIAGREAPWALAAQAPTLRNLAVIACLTWFLVRLVGNLAAQLIEREQAAGTEFDRTTVDALSKLTRLAVVVGGVLTALQTTGFSLSGLLAAGGIGGLAVGFAAKDLLANFFGGLTIYLDRPFSVGDWVRSPDKDIEGTVEHISWRHTRIRRFNMNPLYVPNAVFTSIVVENPSRMTHRRFRVTVGLRRADLPVVDALTAELRALLAAHPAIDQEQPVIVGLQELGESSVDLLVYALTRTTPWADYQALKQELLLAIAATVQRHGAELAFPTRTVRLERDDAPAPAAAASRA